MNKVKGLINKYKNMNKAAKATIWFVICSFFQRGITVITTPIFTRLLTTDEYGLFNVFTSWLEILTVIVTFRICYGQYMRNLVKYPDERDSFTSSMQGLTCVQVAVGLAVYLIFREPLNSFFGMTTPMMLCLFGMILFSTWFSFWSSKERVDFNYRKLILVTVIVSILKPLSGIVLVLSTDDHKVMARIIGLLAVEFIVYVWMFISHMKKGKVFFNKRYWKSALLFNLPLVPHYLSQIILNHSDRIMIKNICGDDMAGIYSLAYSMAMIMVLFNASLQNTITPWSFQQLKDQNYPAMRKIGSLTSFMIASVNFTLIIFAPELLVIFAPKSYHEALYVIPPVAMGVYFMYLYGLFSNVEMYHGRNKYVMIASVTGAVLNLILNAIFIPLFGYIAAAYTTLVCYIVYSSMHFMFTQVIKKKEKIDQQFYDIKIMLLISLSFVSLSFLMTLTYPYPFIRYGIIIVLLILVFIFRKCIIKTVKQILTLKKGVKKQNEANKKTNTD